MVVSILVVVLIVLQVLTAIGTLAILAAMVGVQRRTVESFKLLKRSDIHMECNRRFDRIMDMRDAIERTDADTREVRAFYRRFWELQFDQYVFWINAWVTDEDMHCWVQWRHGDWVENPVLGREGYAFRQSWHDCRERYMEPGFAQFMDQVFSSGAKMAMQDARNLRHAAKSDLAV